MIVPIADQSQIGDARRKAAELARAAGMSSERAGRYALVATELATNVLRHGGGGHILLQRFNDADGEGVECVALDRGAGISDVERCMRDGFSTIGTPGNGLGAVSRQSDLLRIWSHPGNGTAVLARIGTEASTETSPALGIRVGSAVMDYPGETVCGDGWAFRRSRSGPVLLVADGSGHGAEAHRAAALATVALDANLDRDSAVIAEQIHQTLRPTRGAAIGLVRVDAAARTVQFVGVGNISAVLFQAGESQNMVSYNGIAGYTTPRIRRFDYPFTGEVLVILHSDGVSARWKLSEYPGLIAQHPALIAGVLLRDHRRERDDATVVVMRVSP